MWKCSSCSASSMPASRSSSTRSSTWRGERPNLALSPPLFCHLPAPSEARRMRTPRPGSTPSAARLLDHQRQLGRLLDHDEGLQAELAADQREADVLAILVAVADDEAARARQRQHRHQLGLAAGLEAEAFAAVRGQLAGDAAVLVDLDRIDRGVAAGVVAARPSPARTRPAACRRRSPRMSEKRTSSGSFSAAGRGARSTTSGSGDRRAAARRAARTTMRPGRVDVEVALAPVRDRVGLAGAVERPGGHRRGCRRDRGARIVAPGARPFAARTARIARRRHVHGRPLQCRAPCRSPVSRDRTAPMTA